MSLKSKDLHFDSAQPAFLQRLRGQLAGDDSGRHDRPVARNKKQKQDDDEDAPTYVLEDTNDSLTKAEYDAMVAGKDEEGDKSKFAVEAKKDNIAEVGKISKKRKVAKVIGEENDDDPTEDKGKNKASAPEKKVVKKVKKKGKPVKLSFGDEEG